MTKRTKMLNRREFLKRAGVFGAGVGSASFLAACGAQPTAQNEAPSNPPPAADIVTEFTRVDVTGIGEGVIPQLPRVSNKRFDGVEVIVASQSPPTISSPIQKFGPQWEAATGARINLVTFPFGDIYEKLRSALATGTYTFDLINYGSGWAADFMGGGFLAPVPQDVQQIIDVDDYYKPYRDAGFWGDTMYSLTYDGNVHSLFYRRDLFENEEYAQRFADEYGYPLAVPTTWEQYHDVGAFFNSFDWSGTGNSFGAVEAMARGAGSIFFFIGRGYTYMRTPDNPYVFFDPETMRPRINEPGWVQALTDWTNDIQIGPPGAAALGHADVRPVFVSGQAAMITDWGDIASLSYDQSQSNIKGMTGTAMVPGASQVWDSNNNEWLARPDGNPAPHLAFTSWLFGVPQSAQNQEAAWDLAAFLTNPTASAVLNALPDSGIQPSRESTLDNADYMVEAGMDPQDAAEFFATVGEQVRHPNATLDLRIPGAGDYYNALDTAASRAMSGELTPQEALDSGAAAWEEITERFGREGQIQAYLDSIVS